MKSFLRFLLRSSSNLVSGSYFGFSTIGLILGIFFPALTGIGAGLLLALWIPPCLILFIVRGIKEEGRDQGRRLYLEKLRDARQKELEKWKKKPGEPPDSQLLKKARPAKPTSLLKTLWNKARPALEHLRTFATGLRDSAKSVVAILTLMGVLGAAALYALGPVIFSIALTVCVLLAFGAVADAYLRRTHQNKQKELIAEIEHLEIEIARRKESQLPALPQENSPEAKIEVQLENILNKKGNPDRNPYSTKQRIINASKYALKFFTGTVNGGYFGFTMFNLIFGVIFSPITVAPVATIIGIASAVLAVTLAVTYSAEGLKREHTDQKNEKAILNELHYNRKKLEGLKRLAKEHHFDIPPNPDYLARRKIKLPSETRPTFSKRALLTVNQGLNRFRDFWRGSKNSTKLLLNICILFGVLSSTSVLFTTSLPIFFIFAGFAVVFGTACALDYHITAPRLRKIETLQEENREVLRDITYYTQEIRRLNRCHGADTQANQTATTLTMNTLSPTPTSSATSSKAKLPAPTQTGLRKRTQTPTLEVVTPFWNNTTPFNFPKIPAANPSTFSPLHKPATVQAH